MIAPVASAQSTYSLPSGFCYTFSSNIGVGRQGSTADVYALRQVLASQGLLPASAVVQGTAFSDTDASAVTGYQQSHASAILAPYGLSYGTGYVGAATRSQLNASYPCTSSQTTSSTFNPNCPAGALFNSMTGAPCSTNTTTIPGCFAGARFNSMTGAPCTTTNTQTAVINPPANNVPVSTNIPTTTSNPTPTVNLKTQTSSTGANSLFLTASIAGNSLNKNVASWGIQVSCVSGIVVSDKNGNNLCGSTLKPLGPYYYSGSSDIPVLTAPITNNSGSYATVVLILTAYDVNGNSVGSDKEGVAINASTPTPIQTPTVNLKTQTSLTGANSLFLTASIGGDPLNKNVASWGLQISCDSGVTVSDKNENNLCGTTLKPLGPYYYSGSSDILVLTAPTTNSSASSATVGLILTAYDASGNVIGSDKEGVLVGASTPNPTSPAITVLSPNGGESFKNTDTINILYTGVNLSNQLIAYLYSPTLGNLAQVTENNIVGNYGTGKGVITLNLQTNSTATISAGQYKINVCDNNQSPAGSSGKSLCDLSDNFFTITTQ